ncbi:MAG: hypothetical protein ACK5P7_07145 [Bdellovibrio sp.]|jgi:hypothetical protein
MKNFFLIQLGLLVVGAALAGWLVSWDAALSYGIGCLFVFASAGLSAWLWGRLIAKKLVAVALLIIVFKYAIFGIILYKILLTSWVQPLWFSAGIGNIVLAALLAALTTDDDQKMEN